MRKSSFSKIVGALALAMAQASPAFAAPWKFGVMSDTQWRRTYKDATGVTQPGSPDGKNPNSVAVSVIRQLNARFIDEGVKFVVQVGDLTNDGGAIDLDTRATFAQQLYNAGIGFYPLRGNHESSQAGAVEFKRVFLQTQDGKNNATPADALVSNTIYGAQSVTGGPFTVGSHFASEAGFEGLTYAFDYDNARFVLYDQFTPAMFGAPSHSVMTDADATWIADQVAARPVGGHAFVFGHKGVITENHTDTLFGSDPSVSPALQNTLMTALQKSGVRYLFGGHDHMHNRALVASPDGKASIQDITTSSNSYKFYIPQTGANVNDVKYDVPAFGFARETELAQELFTVGYYIVTVDGPRVTVDYWASPNGCNGDCDETTDVIPYTFTKRETFGYSLNGKEFLVPQNGSYTVVSDSFDGTTAKIVDGSNGSATADYAGRSLSHAVDTGWSPRACGTASAALTLWGMSSMVPGLAANETDTYVLSMGYDRDNGHWKFGTGEFGIQARSAGGAWVPAAGLTGGEPKFVIGKWKPGYKLGTYGVDPASKTAWAVVDYQGEFRVANFDDAVTRAVCALEQK